MTKRWADMNEEEKYAEWSEGYVLHAVSSVTHGFKWPTYYDYCELWDRIDKMRVHRD